FPMIGAAWEYRLQHFCTDAYPARTRLESWREILSRKLIQADVKVLEERPFKVEAYMRALPGVRFGWGEFSPSLHIRDRSIVAADNDDFFFLVNLEGSFLASQRQKEVTIGPGEATLLACSELGHYLRPNSGRVLCFRLPSVALTGLVPDAYDRVARTIDESA